jgi:hypothetical protein
LFEALLEAEEEVEGLERGEIRAFSALQSGEDRELS